MKIYQQKNQLVQFHTPIYIVEKDNIHYALNEHLFIINALANNNGEYTSIPFKKYQPIHTLHPDYEQYMQPLIKDIKKLQVNSYLYVKAHILKYATDYKFAEAFQLCHFETPLDAYKYRTDRLNRKGTINVEFIRDHLPYGVWRTPEGLNVVINRYYKLIYAYTDDHKQVAIASNQYLSQFERSMSYYSQENEPASNNDTFNYLYNVLLTTIDTFHNEYE